MRLKDKINEIEGLLIDLEEIIPNTIEEYKSNKVLKAACERYTEKIIEGITDLAFMFIKQKKFEIPEDDIDAFRILFSHKVIQEALYQKLKEAKGMRNIIAHQYGKINDNMVFESITDELGKDVKEFILKIKVSTTHT